MVVGGAQVSLLSLPVPRKATGRHAGETPVAGATKDLKRMHIKIRFRGFPRGPGVKTSPSSAGGSGLIPHASWPKKKQT